MAVDRCVCINQTFASLLARATRSDGSVMTLDELTQTTGAGQQCGLCRPYLARTLQTGQTEFQPTPIISTPED